MLAHLRLWSIVVLVVAATLLLAPAQLAAIRLFPAWSRRLPRLWHRAVTRLLGVRIRVRGEVPAERPMLIVANHVSWADVLVLGAAMPLCFVAKTEVGKMPGIGLLARLQRTVYVDRLRRQQSLRQADSLAKRLATGDVMALFAEGTTGRGQKVMPFKSALFGAIPAAIGQSGRDTLLVQPVAIAYVRLHGLPLGRFHRARASWPSGLPLAPHLKIFLTQGAYDVEVVFGAAERVSADCDRKALARRMEARVRAAFCQSMRMRA